MLTEQISVVLTVTDALEALGISYVIGGSFASAVHGMMRATMDADVVADLRPDHIEPLIGSLESDFYAEAASAREAVERNGSFNVIHLGTMFKVDIFVAKPRSFDRSQLARRKRFVFSEDPERQAYVASAEDVILSKLEWYRMGGEISDRQWNDILGVIKMRADDLDEEYIRRMAGELDVADLLERALGEAGK